MLNKERRFYEFGPFRIDPDRRLLLRENQPVPLQPKAFDILLVLVENAEQVVLKDEILRAVWPDTFVEESNLAQHIFVLRKTLGDAREERRYIITVPGRGYRFTEKVRVFDEEKDDENSVVETHSQSQVVVEEVAVPALTTAPAPVSTPKGQRVRNFVILAVLASLLVTWIGWRRAGKPPQLAERQLTANPPEDWVLGAAISPDGKHVAYHDQTGLYVRSIDSGETRPIALTAELRSRIVGLRWFPDGGKLLAEVSSSDGRDLWVITILGEGDPHLLYRHAWDPAISPDGRMIAFTNRDVGGVRWEVCVGGIDGETPRKLVDGGGLQAVDAPAWSPDGRWIAYARRWKTAQGSFSAAIEARPAGGGAAKTLVAESSLSKPNTISEVNAWFVESWSPDWRLVFSVAESPDGVELQTKCSLWGIRVDPGTGEPGGKPVQLTQWSESWPLNLAITPDGKRLSFVKGRIWTDVYLGELGPDGTSMKVPRRLTFDNRGSELEAWTRDGQAILFVSARNGRREIFRQRLNDNVPEIVVTGRRDAYGVAMSPEGYWLLDTEMEPTRAGGRASDSAWLMRRPVGNGLPELVLELPSAELDAVKCSSNPAASAPCVLGLREGKNLVLYSLDPVRGKGATLGKIEINQSGDLMGWDVSPDGSRVALVDREKYGGRIEILTLLDGAWHEVYLKTEEARLTSIAWAVDGKSFFVTGFFVAAGNPYGVLHVALDGRSLFSTGSRQWVIEPRPSPDGKYLAFAALTYDSNVWVIENF
jgi:DNA-binding winged helix-turn-helix (wHTH) protein/Tol biopolymer transport system component